MVAHAAQIIPQEARFNKPNPSTEMRDTARLIGGRIVFDRAVIMARAWKRARHEAAGYAALGHAALFLLARCFAEALRNAWADAHAMTWKLRPAMPLTERAVIELAIADIEHADRPSQFELARLTELRRQLATLPTAA